MPDRVAVDPADHLAVIDLCNRFCLATDTWDVETMVALFAEDGAVLIRAAPIAAVLIHSLVTARFRRVDGLGWRYLDYEVDGVVANTAMRRED